MWSLLCAVTVCFFVSVDSWCTPFTYGDWHEWSTCTKSCGGGTHKRVKYSCVKSDEKWDTGNCNEFCYNSGNFYGGRCHCPAWRRGDCCSDCDTGYYIPNCKPNSASCGGSPDNVQCTSCNDPYYSVGFGGGCKLCPSIQHCVSRSCTATWNVKCLACHEDNSFYKRTHSDTQCERMCAWDNHYCWPGECSADNLTKNCACAPGFRKVASSSETSCQLNPSNAPSIETCETTIAGPSLDKKQAEHLTKITQCASLADFYGKLQPYYLIYKFHASFIVNISSTPQPTFIADTNFGVTDASIHVILKPMKGAEKKLEVHNMLEDTNQSMNAKDTFANESTIKLQTSSHHLVNGDWLCILYEAKGGGYLTSYDLRLREHSRVPSFPVPYTKTTSTRRLCYRFDSAEPEHCSATGQCSYEPLQIAEKITRSPDLQIKLQGWSDPVPVGGSAKHASGIQSYEITLHEVSDSKDYLKVSKKLQNVTTNGTEDSIYMDLTSNIPKLYAIYLEVKDVADNVRQSRRFVLYDNSSKIEVNPNQTFFVESASESANYEWQTHYNDICLSWANYFYNKFHLDNSLLKKIMPDSSVLVQDNYDQTTGELPVSGTPNVYGIVNFTIAWAMNNGTLSPERTVPDFQKQRYCQHFDLKDGETYTFNVKAIDIVNNTLTEGRIVHIDRSVPHISNIWLEKDGVKSLYVHSGTDLSTMKLTFEALDSHSGVREIKWAFGTGDAGSELIIGSLAVGAVNYTSCPPQSTEEHKCYCPDVGNCEFYRYSIPLNGLVEKNKHQGNHNRNYFFTIKVTNHARLSNTEHVDVLVDDSPPEEGVVMEGSISGKDVDYTSAHDFVVHWHGFIDHESGIKLYKIAVASHCLTVVEINNYNHTRNLPFFREISFTESSIRVPCNFTGKMFTTIVALNNAMDSSKPVCSDGIIRDISAPQIKNVKIQNAKWSDSVICHEGHTWLLNEKIQKVRLLDTPICKAMCGNVSKSNKIVNILPTAVMAKLDEEVSDFMCQKLPAFQEETVIAYLPNDHLYIAWDVEENGSQVNYFSIGIGLQISEESNPSQMEYKNTNHKMFFNKHHTGIGTSELFYVFLKAENKAGKASTYPIGPLMIDETPPVSDSKPVVQILGTDVIIFWENDTIYDLDQKEQINQIFFQFGHDGQPVSPILEWKLKSSPPCAGHSGGCFVYPLRRLQQEDTDLGLDFYASFIGYNNAGHFLKIDTETFKLPSRFPPGNAVVLDMDPNKKDLQLDVDVHFEESTLCATWSGFRHHESILFEFGVGSIPSRDNVISFHKINNTNYHCLTSNLLISGERYHVLIRSTCSGGQTVSASNGVTILTQSFVDSYLKVSVGKNCKQSNETIPVQITSSFGKPVLKIMDSVEIGRSIYIYGLNNNSLLVKDVDGMLNAFDDDNGSIVYSLVPFNEHPELTLNFTVSFGNVKVIYCTNSRFIRGDELYVDSYWYFETRKTYHVGFEAAIIETSKLFANSTAIYKRSTQPMSTKLPTDRLKPGLPYLIAVRVCAQERCLHPVTTGNVSLVFGPIGQIETAEIKVSRNGIDCFDLKLQWSDFISEIPILFYQWVVSSDKNANNIITHWKTMNKAGRNEVKRCIVLPTDLHKHMYGCVRAYTEAEQSVTVCEQLHVTTLAAYETNVVYDIDSKTKAWSTIKPAISSSNLGNIYRILHETELDFATSITTVAGVVLYGQERQIHWYLTRQRKIPMSCTASQECVTSAMTENGLGYYEFATSMLAPGKKFFICAHSNTTYVQRELFTETLKELKTCSDGFMIDDSPPDIGVITVRQTNGYLNDVEHVRISWKGFRDSINASVLGYVDSIKSYSYFIGSTPGADDIQGVTDTGLSTTTSVSLSSVPDGTAIFITVKATNHAGLSSNVSTSGIIVDTSPPHTGDLFINNIHHDIYVQTLKLSVRLLGFSDSESGIEKYELQVGSKPSLSNVYSTEDVRGDSIMLDLPEILMHDGHIYYITVKALNRAGLSSKTVSRSFIMDRSGPTGGHVIDGDGVSFTRDIDYQSNIHHITSHWKGFDDVHSKIQFYRVGLGSKPYDDDIEAMVDIGLSTEITWNASFVPGQKYFTMVEACNKADLCTTRSSDGIIVDNSPPIRGMVRVGSGSQHQSHVPIRSSVHIHWHGFEDPQSDIKQFEACVGSSPGQCDVVPIFNCLLQSNILKTGTSLPRSQYLFATVTAYNKVGMNVSQSSGAFSVDDTPPVLHSSPEFILDFNYVRGYSIQREPSILKMTWKFEDKDSPIIKHFVTLKTHHDGHTPIENLQLGSENNLTIALDEKSWLSNGDKYHAVVTCCNAAGLCTSATSNDLLIDYTPPHLGGFMPPMTWNTSVNTTRQTDVTLTWYGFHDQESDIEKYFITVSRSYSGSELTNGPVEIKANASEIKQCAKLSLEDGVRRDDALILSIWAQNNAGLNSSVARVSVDALTASTTSTSYGILELEKHSCDVHYCNKDCTCAVIGQPCVAANMPQVCKTLNENEVKKLNLPSVTVFPGVRGYDITGQVFTASSACLSAYWNVDHSFDLIHRFEWSMGLKGQPIGEGIFDLKNEIPWKDIGLHTDVVHCLQTNRTLIHGESYIVYIRAWYGPELSSIFKFSAVTVDHTPPSVRQGRFVKDSDGLCSLDFDFIDWMDTITACWTGVFSERQSNIYHYTVALGTSPNADDGFKRTNVGTSTNLTLSNLKLSHGTKYFFSVTAYNILGLYASISSDGFVVDMDKPVAGVVFNTGHHTNMAYQQLNSSLTFSWHGFIDHFSGIRSYFVSLMIESYSNITTHAFLPVGLQTSHTFDNLNFETGMKIRALVKAADAAGHESEVSVSPSVTVDSTPPLGYTCNTFEELLRQSSDCSMENNFKLSSAVYFNSSTFYRVLGTINKVGLASASEIRIGRRVIPLPIELQNDGSGKFKYTSLQRKNGHLYIEIRGTCILNSTIIFTFMKCDKFIENEESAVNIRQIGRSTFQIQSSILDHDSGVAKISVGLGTTTGGFQIRGLTDVHQGVTDVLEVDIPHSAQLFATAVALNYAGQRAKFHSRPIRVDKTPPVITQSPVIKIDEMTNVTDAITVSWEMIDNESGIKQCYCKIGIQGTSAYYREFVPAYSTSTYRLDNVTIVHGDIITSNVRCVNGIELASEAVADSLRVSKNSPLEDKAAVKITEITDTNNYVQHRLQETTKSYNRLAVQSNLSYVQMQWSGFTDISGIHHYEYRLTQGQLSLMEWVNAGKHTTAMVRGVRLDSGVIYTAEVRAANVGHHTSEAVRADVLVLGSKPQLTGAPMSITKTGNVLQLDWSKAFELNINVGHIFTLLVGSKLGYNDIINDFYTTDTTKSISVPESTLDSPVLNELFVRLECTYVTGLSSVYATNYKLS